MRKRCDAMKEIGGYFGLEKLICEEYYPDLIAVNNARNGLIFLIRAKQIKKIYLPYYLCDSVRLACESENVEYEMYHVDEHFRPIFDIKLDSSEFLYVVNYFGQVDNEMLTELKQQYGNIIADNVQAFFQKPVEGVDTIYSCRKFFGVPDGAYVATDVRGANLPIDKSKDRMKHLLGRFEDENASEYYAEFKANDNAFKSVPLCAMSAITHNILGAIDYSSVKKTREVNFAVLHEMLGEKNGLNIIASSGPYAYPFYCKDGMEIKRKLAEKKIYVPTLWPNVLTLDDTIEKEYAENILPLPCDQRYSADDMKIVAESVLINL